MAQVLRRETSQRNGFTLVQFQVKVNYERPGLLP